MASYGDDGSDPSAARPEVISQSPQSTFMSITPYVRYLIFTALFQDRVAVMKPAGEIRNGDGESGALRRANNPCRSRLSILLTCRQCLEEGWLLYWSLARLEHTYFLQDRRELERPEILRCLKVIPFLSTSMRRNVGTLQYLRCFERVRHVELKTNMVMYSNHVKREDHLYDLTRRTPFIAELWDANRCWLRGTSLRGKHWSPRDDSPSPIEEFLQMNPSVQLYVTSGFGTGAPPAWPNIPPLHQPHVRVRLEMRTMALSFFYGMSDELLVEL